MANSSLSLIHQFLSLCNKQQRGLNVDHNLDDFVLDELVRKETVAELLSRLKVLHHEIVASHTNSNCNLSDRESRFCQQSCN